MLCFLAIIPNHTPVKNSENFANFPFILHHHYQSLLGAIEQRCAGRSIFLRGGARVKIRGAGQKKRVKPLIHTFVKSALWCLFKGNYGILYL